MESQDFGGMPRFLTEEEFEQKTGENFTLQFIDMNDGRIRIEFKFVPSPPKRIEYFHTYIIGRCEDLDFGKIIRALQKDLTKE